MQCVAVNTDYVSGEFESNCRINSSLFESTMHIILIAEFLLHLVTEYLLSDKLFHTRRQHSLMHFTTYLRDKIASVLGRLSVQDTVPREI